MSEPVRFEIVDGGWYAYGAWGFLGDIDAVPGAFCPEDGARISARELRELAKFMAEKGVGE